MTEVLAHGMPSDIGLILRLSEGEDRGLLALSIPEAITDVVAETVLRASGMGDRAARFARLIQSCDFVVTRNGEWRLSAEAKTYLQPICYGIQDLWAEVNEVLFETASRENSDELLPSYLRDPAGRAYHRAALDPEEGVRSYVNLAVAAEYDAARSTTWLANRLAHEQQALGILPKASSELDFLTAMTLYADGERSHSIDLLRATAELKGQTMPIAVACHLLGRWDGDPRSKVHYRVAVKLLKRSIRIGEILNNYQHVAQVKHTLALILLMNDRPRREREAVQLLEDSLQTLTTAGDTFGVAKVLHTYGQALARSANARDHARSRTMLVQSLQIGQMLGKRRHEASVISSLADLLERTDPKLGERARVTAVRMQGGRDNAHLQKRKPSSRHNPKRSR